MSGGYFSGFKEGIDIIGSLFGMKRGSGGDSIEKVEDDVELNEVPFWESYLRGVSIIEEEGGKKEEKEALHRALDEISRVDEQDEVVFTILKKKEVLDKSRRNIFSRGLDRFGEGVMWTLRSMNPFRGEEIEISPLIGEEVKRCMWSEVCLDGLAEFDSLKL